MYQPRHFRVDDLGRQHALMRERALALIVVELDGSLEASHVPVLLDAAAGAHGELRFHVARANPLALALDGMREALFVFQGEDAYVSPDWYRSPQMVPTWNYAAVHAYATPHAVDDPELAHTLDAQSADQESRIDKTPWKTDKLADEHYVRMRRAIIGFRAPIARIQGKWKMGQNRQPQQRRGVIDALAGLGTADAAATARTMNALLREDGDGES